jgi:NAD(P)H dehydrogenase (quinone)
MTMAKVRRKVAAMGKRKGVTARNGKQSTSEALGRKIVFQDLPIDEYCTSIEAMGVPPYVVQHLRGAMADYQTGHMSGTDNNVEKLTGRRSMTVGEFARAHLDKLNPKNN